MSFRRPLYIGRYPKVKATIPIATPHRGPFASTTIPAGRLQAYIPRFPKVPCTCEKCFQGGPPCARTMRLLSVDDSLSRRANWGAHAEYAYWNKYLVCGPDIVCMTYVRATRKRNKSGCDERHKPPILSDPMEFHDECRQVRLHCKS